MAKINKKKHVTKKGVVKNNPEKKIKYGVFTYFSDTDTNVDNQYFSNKADAINYAKAAVEDMQYDEPYYVEVWLKPSDGLWGNTGSPIFERSFELIDINMIRLEWDPENDSVDEEFHDTVNSIKEANDILKHKYSSKKGMKAEVEGKVVGYNWGSLELVESDLREKEI